MLGQHKRLMPVGNDSHLLIIVIDVYTAIKPKKCPSLILDMVKWFYLIKYKYSPLNDSSI